jgi:hypothetical protein
MVLFDARKSTARPLSHVAHSAHAPPSGFTVVLLLATIIAVTIVHAQPALASQCGSPNYYAYGHDNTSDRYGIEGNIQSYNHLNSGYTNENFTDQAGHVYLVSGQGLEVGWFEGWGNQIQAYVNDAHTYSTANGPREVDGPEVDNANDYYRAYWGAAGNERYNVENSSGDSIFEGNIGTDGYTGPGDSYAVGEVAQNGTAMEGVFENLEHQFGTGGPWYDWAGMTTCADPGYTATSPASNIFSDY